MYGGGGGARGSLGAGGDGAQGIIVITYTPIVGDVSETLTLSDSVDGGMLYDRAITETLAPTDSVDGGMLYERAVTETLAPTDAVAAQAEFGAAISETLALTDALGGHRYRDTESILASRDLVSAAGIGQISAQTIAITVSHVELQMGTITIIEGGA